MGDVLGRRGRAWHTVLVLCGDTARDLEHAVPSHEYLGVFVWRGYDE